MRKTNDKLRKKVSRYAAICYRVQSYEIGRGDGAPRQCRRGYGAATAMPPSRSGGRNISEGEGKPARGSLVTLIYCLIAW